MEHRRSLIAAPASEARGGERRKSKFKLNEDVLTENGDGEQFHEGTRIGSFDLLLCTHVRFINVCTVGVRMYFMKSDGQQCV